MIIPAYDAARTLPAVLERVPPEVDAQVQRRWIIDDGSRDRTRQVARQLARRDPRTVLLVHPRNLGYGAAMKTGLAAARRAGVEVAVGLHADGQYAPEVLGGLLRALRREALDLLQGSRIASGTALSGGMPLYKYIAGQMLMLLENRVFGLSLTDYHSGYLLYGRRALEQIPFERLSDSFDFDLEVIASARARGLRIGERPIPTHYGDELSHLEPVGYGLRVLRVMLRYLRGGYDSTAA
ncbi:MAG: glycosyltransferase family 2 protein [Myxococcales bacterium]|nr:glycosyltransferase family 2 protein [Myxococcales bacterium]